MRTQLKAIATITAGWLIIFVVLALAAPVPKAKPTPPPPALENNTFQCVWGGDPGEMQFHKGGGYSHTLHMPRQPTFIGKWHIAGDGSVVVSESQLMPHGLGTERVFNFVLDEKWNRTTQTYHLYSNGDYATKFTLTIPKKK